MTERERGVCEIKTRKPGPAHERAWVGKSPLSALRSERYGHSMRHVWTSLFALALLVAAGPATAETDDTRLLPDVQRPPTLPELTHADNEATLETTMGTFTSNPTSPLSNGHTPVQTQRLNVEIPLARRRWFAGANYQTAMGAPSSPQAIRVISGNAEIYGRGVWATPTGLAFGGGFGVMLPVANFNRETENRDVALAAITLRPWDESAFQEGFLSMRPFVDVRDAIGPLVFQLRQGLDWQFAVRGGGSTRLLAVTSIYAGYRITPVVAAGVELFELYYVDAPVADDRRLYVTMVPNVRLMFDRVQPTFGVIANLVNAAFPGVDRVWGARFGLTVLW